MDNTQQNRQPVDVALLIIRLALSAVFIYHGYGICSNIPQFAGYIKIPVAAAWLVGGGELLGGLGMLAGLLSRIAGVGLAIIMFGAIVTYHWAHGFSITNQGYEYVLTLLLNGLAITIAGPGKYSLEHALSARKSASH